jgi:proline dehydrogenase
MHHSVGKRFLQCNIHLAARRCLFLRETALTQQRCKSTMYAGGAIDHSRPKPATTAPAHKSSSSTEIDFNDTRTSYSNFTTTELIRAFIVLKICGIQPLVANAEKLLKLSYKMLGKTITEAVVRSTFFSHFCAGETAQQVGVRVRRLQQMGVNGIFDYAAEEDEAPPTTAAAPATAATSTTADQHPTAANNKVVARQFVYTDEALCDARAAVFLDCIHAVRDQSPGGFAAVKMTALGNPLLLRRASECVIELRNLFYMLDEGGTGTITPAQFETGYRKL